MVGDEGLASRPPPKGEAPRKLSSSGQSRSLNRPHRAKPTNEANSEVDKASRNSHFWLLSDCLGHAFEEAMLSPDERSDLSCSGVPYKNGSMATNKFVSDAIAIRFPRFILEP
jgi:hypothetical protein